MTDDRAFKKDVRARMRKTGENYTTARRALLGEAARMPLLIVDTYDEAAPELDADEFAYTSYFENVYGERLALTWSEGELHATLWHSDADYEPRRVAATYDEQTARRFANAGIDVDRVESQAAEYGAPVTDIILNGAEATWLQACWMVLVERMELTERHRPAA